MTGSIIRIPVHLEVCLKANSTTKPSDLNAGLCEFLESNVNVFRDGPLNFSTHPILSANVAKLEICGVDDHPRVIQGGNNGCSFNDADVLVHCYRLNDEGSAEEAADDADNVSACSQWVLPAKEFDGMWESLVFETDVKRNLLDYAATAMIFSDKCVNSNLIGWNRVVLLHGPPGTGKTSLCKALAQKLAIRFSHRYQQGQLLEINAHSLFSKWFSESGKLVQKLFSKIRELVEDEDSLVCVLIDEVESLTAARQAALSGAEPTDSIRVVNALLTQIDRLKEFNNVIIITTSNITEAIDLAFVDRADIKQYIGLPNERARYDILSSCVEELARVGIVTGANVKVPPYLSLPNASNGGRVAEGVDPRAASCGLLLREAASLCAGLSGRALRKLPFTAHANFIQSPTVDVVEFLKSLQMSARKEKNDRKEMNIE